jgi:hypothetical protein
VKSQSVGCIVMRTEMKMMYYPPLSIIVYTKTPDDSHVDVSEKEDL